MIDKLKNNKAFTLIELIVVIAVLGVLVLLAAPRFLGYTEDAKVVQIKNDVKVVENALEIELIDDPEYMVNEGWETVTLETMNGYVNEGSLFDTKGNVGGELDGKFYVIEDELAKTKLNGKFIVEKGGKVYYYEDGLNVGGDDEERYVLATDEDFDWVKYSAITGSGERVGQFHNGEWGYFHYTGNHENVEIPHVIHGTPVTKYYKMFHDTGVKKIKSTNKNVISVREMFANSQANTLDLSSFDTSNVTNMIRMFYNSKATSLDLSSFDTSSVTSMSGMLDGSKATTLDLSSFDTSSVTSMSSMFNGSKVANLNLSNFDTSNVTSMSYMFSDSQVESITGLNKFNTSNVTNMSGMFLNSQATSLDLSSFDTSNVESTFSMFKGSQATTLDLSSFDTSNVTDKRWMFEDSQATTGYARTQEDADRFNNNTMKPSGLTFIVK